MNTNTQTQTLSITTVEESRLKRLSTLLASLGALLLSTLLYGSVFLLVPHESWAYQLLFERSLLQHINTYIFFITLLLLFLRWWGHRVEVKACGVVAELVQEDRYRNMVWANAYTLTAELNKPEHRRERGSLVFSRVLRALDRVEKTKSTAEMREYMRIRSEIDSDELDSSFASIRYFAWLIPTLGFIGTVLGIGNGISGCGDIILEMGTAGGASFERLSPALDALGTAFDTTLLALVYSAVVVLFMSFVQKGQEQLLEWIDHICIDEVCGSFQEHSTVNDELIRRLKSMEETLTKCMHGDRDKICQTLTAELPPNLAAAMATGLHEALAPVLKNTLGEAIRPGQEQAARLPQRLDELCKELGGLREILSRMEKEQEQGRRLLQDIAANTAPEQSGDDCVTQDLDQ